MDFNFLRGSEHGEPNIETISLNATLYPATTMPAALVGRTVLHMAEDMPDGPAEGAHPRSHQDQSSGSRATNAHTTGVRNGLLWSRGYQARKPGKRACILVLEDNFCIPEIRYCSGRSSVNSHINEEE